MAGSREDRRGGFPLSLLGVVEAIFVAAAIDMAFRFWALGRAVLRRSVPDGLLWRRRG
jgi:hypothetical protein